MIRNNTLKMILLRLAVALIVGTIMYFVIKDIRKDLGIDSESPTAFSEETETIYDWA